MAPPVRNIGIGYIVNLGLVRQLWTNLLTNAQIAAQTGYLQDRVDAAIAFMGLTPH